MNDTERLSLTQADMHEFCKWLNEQFKEEQGFITDRSLALVEVINKLKEMELWT